jgi:K+/H+ antiporter YhaU regulatory subunit KhtT
VLALATFFVIVFVSLLVTRVATVVLTLTGLSQDIARFQARSAFSGAGFTTREAESVVEHPLRRRVVQTLMLLGSAGLLTAIATLMLSFVSAGGEQSLLRIGVLLAGLVMLWLAARSRWVDRRLSAAIAWALRRWTDLEGRDYAALLHLSGDYAVMELKVEADDWIAGRSLEKLSLRDEGIVVLGITRAEGTYLGVPTDVTCVRPGDVLVLYGRTPSLSELDRRKADRAGDRAREQAIAEQRRVLREEAERDRAESQDRDAAS